MHHRAQIGRTSLEARSPQRSPPASKITVNSFALHRPSLLLLEQLATTVRLNEPLLLVGETGTYKTTVIQSLAPLPPHPLTAFNLSNQTEASDLVGGFKPIDAQGFPAITAHQPFLGYIGLVSLFYYPPHMNSHSQTALLGIRTWDGVLTFAKLP